MRQSSLIAPATAEVQEQDSGQAKDRILLTAEQLFASHGFNGVSLRTIMAEAEVNTAAVHYYFRNKEGLLRAIFEMRVAPMNEERSERLAKLDSTSREGGSLKISEVLNAFIEPAVRRSREPGGLSFNRISALCSVDPSPSVRRIVFDSYDMVARQFTDLLRRACLHLTDEEFFWRQHFIYGSMMYLRTDNGRVAYLLGDLGSNNSEAALEQLLLFLTAGMGAPGSAGSAAR